MTKHRYDLYLNTPKLGIVLAADVVVVEEGANLRQVGFRYLPDYLAKPAAFPVDPVQLPLMEGEIVLNCRGGAPAFLDDYLPDAWGRRVLARLALYRDNRHFNANSVIDSLALLSNSRIGAMSLVERGDEPAFDNGHALEVMAQAEQAAQHIDDVDYNAVDVDEMSLLYLANAGTGVGGARPKALLYDDHGQYLAKFNRKNAGSL
jgi:serine/threonine-protein kinase HipA